MAFRAFQAAPKAAPWASLNAQLPRAPAFRRFYAASTQEQPRLRLGSTGMATMDHVCMNIVLIVKNSPQLQGSDHQGRDRLPPVYRR